MEISVTDLHWAVRSNDVGTVKKLLAGGSSVQCTDSMGRTPLHWATVLGHEEALKALLLNTSKRLIDLKDKQGRTSLHYACAAGKIDFAGILIKRGASADARDSKGRTPLHFAAQNVKPDMVELLLGRGASKDVADCNGLKPWDLALKWGCPDGFGILRIDSSAGSGFAEPEIGDGMKISDDIGSNRAEVRKHDSGAEKPSSLDTLLREWKKAEGEARKKKKKTGAIDDLQEALKAWREAEAEARLKKQSGLINQPAHIEQGLKNQVPSCSYASNSSQGLQDRGSGCSAFSAHSNRSSTSPALASEFLYKKEDEVEGRVYGAWGCTEWESPVRIEDIRPSTNGAERWEKVAERRFGPRLPVQAWKEPWVRRTEQAPSSAIEAI